MMTTVMKKHSTVKINNNIATAIKLAELWAKASVRIQEYNLTQPLREQDSALHYKSKCCGFNQYYTNTITIKGEGSQMFFLYFQINSSFLAHTYSLFLNDRKIVCGVWR